MTIQTCGCIYNAENEIEHLCPLHYEAVTTMGAKDNPALRLACEEVAIIARERDEIKKKATTFTAQLTEMTAERDSETKWAKQYCDDMVRWQQTAANLEKVMDGMKADIERVTAERDAARFLQSLDRFGWALTAEFLGDASNELSNHTCNDYSLPNTPENYAFMKAAGLWNTKGVENEDSEVRLSKARLCERQQERIDELTAQVDTLHRAIAGIRSVIDGSSFVGHLVLSILDGDVNADPAEYARIHTQLRAQAAEIRAKLEAEYDAEQKK